MARVLVQIVPEHTGRHILFHHIVVLFLSLVHFLANRTKGFLLLAQTSLRGRFECSRLLGRTRTLASDRQRPLVGVGQERGQLRKRRRQDRVGNGKGSRHRVGLDLVGSVQHRRRRGSRRADGGLHGYVANVDERSEPCLDATWVDGERPNGIVGHRGKIGRRLADDRLVVSRLSILVSRDIHVLLPLENGCQGGRTPRAPLSFVAHVCLFTKDVDPLLDIDKFLEHLALVRILAQLARLEQPIASHKLGEPRIDMSVVAPKRRVLRALGEPARFSRPLASKGKGKGQNSLVKVSALRLCPDPRNRRADSLRLLSLGEKPSVETTDGRMT